MAPSQSDPTPISPGLFYARSVLRFAFLPIARRIARGTYRRSADAVRAEYDPQRTQFAREFRTSDWSVDEYVLRDAGDDLDRSYYFANVIDGQLVLGGSDVVRRRLLERLASAVREYGARSVIEVGSGTGRNLLFLKQQFPALAVTGLELSAPSVELAREAAARYGLAARFEVQDVMQEWAVDPADLVISIHAIEQLPESSAALHQMTTHARKAVVMFEPLPDLWSGIPGLAGKLRARHLDRLKQGAMTGFEVSRKELLPNGMALNRTTEVHLRPAAPAKEG